MDEAKTHKFIDQPGDTTTTVEDVTTTMLKSAANNFAIRRASTQGTQVTTAPPL